MNQKDFWENKIVLKRRSPSHPVIEAFVLPKIHKMMSVIGRESQAEASACMTLLDIGSGNGYFSYHLRSLFDVTCLDFSHKILSICPMNKKIQANAEQIPFKDNSFHIVFAENLLHHSKEPDMIINEMLRVSSRYIVLIEPNRLNPFMFLISWVSRTGRSILRFSSAYMKKLMNNKAGVMCLETTGFILPNITPLFFYQR